MTAGIDHVGVAEQGKVLALAGDHETALVYYREAMRGAVDAGAPEASFRHYLECAIESLELVGAYEAVIDYCDKVADHYSSYTPAGDAQRAFIAADLAHNAQRRGVVLAKQGQRTEALAALREAGERARLAGLRLPLADVVAGWLERGLQLDAHRLEAEQRRLCYFAVTPETVDRSRAVELPSQVVGRRRG